MLSLEESPINDVVPTNTLPELSIRIRSVAPVPVPVAEQAKTKLP